MEYPGVTVVQEQGDGGAGEGDGGAGVGCCTLGVYRARVLLPSVHPATLGTPRYTTVLSTSLYDEGCVRAAGRIALSKTSLLRPG